MNVYDPTIHGVCGYPRPVIDLRSERWLDERDAARAGRGRCSCGLEVRLDESTGLWLHYVEGDAAPAAPVLAAELVERIAMTRQAHDLFRNDLRGLVEAVRDLGADDELDELDGVLDASQDVPALLDALETAIRQAEAVLAGDVR